MLEVKDATIALGERVLATGLSFIAHDGELTCITGAEGAGKTTLLRTLMGFLPVKQGFVSVDGELLTVHSAHAFRTLMAYLPQQMQLLGHQLTPPEAPLVEADDFGVWNPALPKAPLVATAEELSPHDIFRLAEQTLAEAAGKQIIIADEPAARLTPELEQQMLDLLRQQAAAGKTVLIASRRPLLVNCADQLITLTQS